MKRLRSTTRIINLEAGRPTAAEARHRLLLEIDRAESNGTFFLKVIHGYGSSGVGGALRDHARRCLIRLRNEGRLSYVIFGERLNVFDPTTQQLIDEFPTLKADPDFARDNEGITLAVLCSRSGHHPT